MVDFVANDGVLETIVAAITSRVQPELILLCGSRAWGTALLAAQPPALRDNATISDACHVLDDLFPRSRYPESWPSRRPMRRVRPSPRRVRHAR